MPVGVQRLMPLWFRVENTAEAPQLQFEGHQHPCRVAEAHSHGLTVQQTIETPKLVEDKVVDAPFAQVVQAVDIPVVPQRLIPMDFLTIEIPLLLFLDKVIDDPECGSCRFLKGTGRIVILVVHVHLSCRDGPPENCTVFRLPLGTLLAMGAVFWYSSPRLLRYLRALPCGLDYVYSLSVSVNGCV